MILNLLIWTKIFPVMLLLTLNLGSTEIPIASPWLSQALHEPSFPDPIKSWHNLTFHSVLK